MNFKKSLSAILLALSTQTPLHAQTAPVNPPQIAQASTICPAQLPKAIDSITNRPEFRRASWGISIEPLATSTPLYHRQAEKYFIPASNAKLLTTAAALLKLGPDYRIRTSVYANPVNGDSVPVLRVVGRGDPSLTTAQLKSLATQLKNWGIRNVNQLVIDDGFFRGDLVNANWEFEDIQAGYGAPVNSLILNQNAVNFTLFPQQAGEPLLVKWDDSQEGASWEVENTSMTVTSNEEEFIDVGRDLTKPVLYVSGQLRAGSEPESTSVAITQPATNFLQKFRQVLAAEGIRVKSTKVIKDGTPNADEVELAMVSSPPLIELINRTNVDSDNLYAEVLLRLLGTVSDNTKAAQFQTANAGLDTIRNALAELGLDPKSYKPADGSGLSRHNLTSPEALVNLLRVMASTPVADMYRNSLPVAGVSGTLASRFRNTPAQGIVQAKTGTLSGVASLSGYLNNRNYEPLVFSIIVNQSDLTSSTIRRSIDDIVVLLSRLRRC
ncbi:D-alanyl-D-alanine carboxypeptidase/D-alanyl-D-alanine-endopeptidase [Ancylothrix sp. C2]|uniref:D-alanyl-D-alanine carboxypeptidase/D-alanyl-D-alanine endopeptidase n=1 Tax=Ancylothrix sp. D3o TaxID=2953691 RepID=UPI0021BA5877|nr:D-alanyl-D-alanine carboxypeptidase/D-alanyl-D-alanine-endopeptidase [Ancylothrix sp. D3o]MCT7951506.1 D-alanyl-D-alanine carboxypeptidase/D-alanyl-D-alanine-endopeptidase [Ancylothrix sp. D3o]